MADTREAEWSDSRTAWYGVLILAVAQAVSGLDRNILNIVVPAIKHDLHLSDSQLGLLLGFAFALFYATIGLPIGRIADSRPRKFVIAIGMAFWTLATAAGGLARTFPQLLASRMAVGAGEAALNPCGYTMIADYFPPEKRALPIGLFIGGQTIGAAAAIFGGGTLLQYFSVHHLTVSLPGLGAMAPWQLAMLCVAAPGVVVTLLVLTLSEPSRKPAAHRDLLAKTQAKPAQASLGEIARFFWARSDIYVPLFLALGLILMLELGKGAWMPSILMRALHWTPAQIGVRLGLITLIVPTSGALLGGSLMDAIAKSGRRLASFHVAIYVYAVVSPMLLVALLTHSDFATAVLLVPTYMGSVLPLVVGSSIISLITPPRMRVQFTAIFLLSNNMIGYGIGPVVIGLLSDYVYPAHDGIRYALATVAAVVIPAAIGLLWLGIHNFGVAQARQTRAPLEGAPNPGGET